MLGLGDECPYGTVCFHAQQVVEKYLKAWLTYLSVDFPKTHDIGELVGLVPSDIAEATTPFEQEVLTRYATVTRYPGDWEPLTREDAEEAVAVARKVRGAVRDQLPSELAGGEGL